MGALKEIPCLKGQEEGLRTGMKTCIIFLGGLGLAKVKDSYRANIMVIKEGLHLIKSLLHGPVVVEGNSKNANEWTNDNMTLSLFAYGDLRVIERLTGDTCSCTKEYMPC